MGSDVCSLHHPQQRSSNCSDTITPLSSLTGYSSPEEIRPAKRGGIEGSIQDPSLHSDSDKVKQQSLAQRKRVCCQYAGSPELCGSSRVPNWRTE